MSYLESPATEMVATLCACCSTPLVDAISVETGIGPVCRKKHGYAEAQSAADWNRVFTALEVMTELGGTLGASWVSAVEAQDARRAANILVHRIAVQQDGADVGAMTGALAALGFTALAHRIVVRVAKVHIIAEGQRLVVVAPYNPEFVQAARRIPGRDFDRPRKANTFPMLEKRAVFRALCRHFDGATAFGPKGLFVIDAKTLVQQRNAA